MYEVSAEYLEKMMHHGTRRRLSGTIGSVPFTGDDVVLNSFNVSGRATEESETKIGGVFLGELEMTFVPSFLTKIPRDQYENKEVSVSIGLFVGESWIDVPIGVYTLQAPKISKQGIAVSGYDHMQKLDKSFNIDQTSATPFGYLSYIATECDVELGNTQAEIEALPNGTELLGIYPENDIETFRDLLYWLAQTCGCFACCDRAGRIVLRKLGNPNGVEFDEMHRDTDVVFSGYTTKWTGISVVDMASQTTNYYGLETDDGLTMNLGSNPLLQLGTKVAVDRRRRNVLNAIAQIQYTPFYMNSARDPIFDLGDEIIFTGGISGNSTGCIMAYSYSLDSFNFEGYGDNPTLANARSKTDKNISGLIQTTAENEVTYYNYANLEEISFGSEQEVSIAKLRFTSAQQTTVKILHEFILDMLADLSQNCSYEVRYYLDEELLTYTPYEQIKGIYGGQSGITELSICRDFFYILKDVDPNITHTWDVRVITHGINSTTIDVNNAHVTLEGQRMYGEDYFDGFIEARDNLTIIPLGVLGLVSVVDGATIDLRNATISSASDNIAMYSVATMQLLPITEGTGELSPHVFLQLEPGDILTEDGDSLTTEDGDTLIL